MLDARAERNVKGVHPDLVRVFRRASMQLPSTNFRCVFSITCGVRTLEEQRHLFAIGATRTMNSRHLRAPNGYSHAGDVVVLDRASNGSNKFTRVAWDWPLYEKLSVIIKHAAELERVPVTWGGDWPKFRDGPHYELPWNKYPGTKGT